MVDPFESSTGLSAPRFKADIVIKTLTLSLKPGKAHPETHDGEMFNVSGPGEYEVKGISISGWPLLKDSSPDFLKSVYRVKTDDITIGLLGHLSEFSEPEIFEELGEIDVLMIPGGGTPFISQESSAKLIRQISPRIVIPCFFQVPGLKRKTADVSDFLKEIGQKAEPEEKLSIKHKDLGEKMRVVVLKV
jgi:L-ascorbate metabolism protein UlaG (beta-lactamase superfamily)